ncbi:hypothetical protein A6R68_17465, partial [Neotoma lepida]
IVWKSEGNSTGHVKDETRQKVKVGERSRPGQRLPAEGRGWAERQEHLSCLLRQGKIRNVGRAESTRRGRWEDPTFPQVILQRPWGLGHLTLNLCDSSAPQDPSTGPPCLPDDSAGFVSWRELSHGLDPASSTLEKCGSGLVPHSSQAEAAVLGRSLQGLSETGVPSDLPFDDDMA